jgi:hypothetical protein
VALSLHLQDRIINSNYSAWGNENRKGSSLSTNPTFGLWTHFLQTKEGPGRKPISQAFTPPWILTQNPLVI